jgi:hypothetical protein
MNLLYVTLCFSGSSFNLITFFYNFWQMQMLILLLLLLLLLLSLLCRVFTIIYVQQRVYNFAAVLYLQFVLHALLKYNTKYI